MNRLSALNVTSAFALMEGRTRREWKLTLETLRLIGVTWPDVESMTQANAWKWLGWDAARYREWLSALDISRARCSGLRDSQISVISDLDENAPSWLRKLPTVPWVVYEGELSILDHITLGFSGQRDAGEAALEITGSLGSEAARLGYTVVSGGARGIDMAAHVAVLEAGGATAVILPQGLETWNPPYALANPDVSDRVLAISEDVPWEAWNTESAMRRNRMIVDLSTIFTVPQAGTGGGSHSTARYALKQGRVTFVPDLGPEYPGNRHLLQRNARLLEATGGRFDLEQMLAESIPAEEPRQSPLF